MVNVVSSINLSVQYTEGLEYSQAAQGGVPCAPVPLCSAREGKPEALEQWTGGWGTRNHSQRNRSGWIRAVSTRGNTHYLE